VRTPLRLAAYILGLVALFGAALAAGRAVGPLAGPAVHESATDSGHGGHGEPAGQAKPPAGLQISQDGYRLQLSTTTLSPDAPVEFAFRVLGPDGHPVTR
jgi:hypothetical protein